jgi:hypothetical protein
VRHEIDVEVEPSGLNVEETLVIKNPSLLTYVGEKAADETLTTLRLSIPPTFERVTFRNEFYGRRFRIVDHQPVTDIPWPPGERELRFGYKVPLESNAATLRRVLDLPSGGITVRVRGRKTSDVACNLSTSQHSQREIVFSSDAAELPKGHVIELQVGAPPIPWLRLARYGSIVTMFALAGATVVFIRRREGPGKYRR